MSTVDDRLIQEVRDELSRMRGHLFETIEAMGLPDSQQNGVKGLIRVITYNSQATIEGALRANGAKP